MPCSIIPLNKIIFLNQTINKSIEEYKIYLELLIKTVNINIRIDSSIYKYKMEILPR